MGRCRLLAIVLLGLVGLGCANGPPRAATGQQPPPFAASDLVIAIDHSTLGLLASGIDVDRDGRVGRTVSGVTQTTISTPLRARSFTTDPADTVHALQLRVASALVPTLAARQTRLGLVAFSIRDRGMTHARFADKPTIVVPVGPAEPVLAALLDFPDAQERRHTDLARLLERAAELLDNAAAHEPDPTRTRAILLLSHGLPSAPDGIHWASRRALAVARELGSRGIAIWVVPFGVANVAYLEELTEVSGGGVVPLDQLYAQFGPVSR